MIEGHALVHRPSSMFRTMGCTGWLQLSMDIEEEETQDSREGTAAHWVGESVLQSYQNESGVLTCESFIDKQAPNGVIIDENMCDSATIYTRDILQICQDHGLLQRLRIEDTVRVAAIHPDCFGTGDATVWDEVTQTLYVWDFKYGHGSVLARGNYQLCCYAQGAIEKLGINPQCIVMRIVQPRCFDGLGPIREWVTDVNTLNQYINFARQQCAIADSVDATLTAGEHCTNCPARIRCEAITRTTGNIVDYAQTNLNVMQPTSLHLALELDTINKAQELLKARKNGVEQEMKRRMREGQNIPCYSQEPTYSNDAWKHDAKDVIALAELFGVDFTKQGKASLITPNQACAILKKNNIDPSVIMSYYGKTQTGHKLVKSDNDKLRLIFKESSNG